MILKGVIPVTYLPEKNLLLFPLIITPAQKNFGIAVFPYLSHLNNCHLSISLKYTSNSQLNYYFLMATLAMDSTLA